MFDFLTAENEESALEQLHDLGCTDGLPVIIPTVERVTKSILATGLDGDMVLGVLGPLMGVATVEKIAAAAVMAGCKPDANDNNFFIENRQRIVQLIFHEIRDFTLNA